MVPGTILFDPQFRFRDGKTGAKLFVVLNDGRNGVFIVVKTTSNDSRYSVVYGCQITARFPHFYLPKGSCCLPEHTWLCLDDFYELDSDDLIQRVISTRINRRGVLTPELTLEVQGCVLNSDDISQAQAGYIREVWLEAKAKAQAQTAGVQPAPKT
jgi:hypothetical protein